jgi:hypothetical protein
MGRFHLSFIWREVGGSLILKSYPAMSNKGGPAEPPSSDLVGAGQGGMEARALLLWYFQRSLLGVTGRLGPSVSCSTAVRADRLVTRPLPAHRAQNQWVFLWGVDKSWTGTSGGGGSGLWP